MLETMGLRLMNHDPASPAAGIDFNKLPMPCVLPLADVPPAKYAVPHPWTGKFAMNNELQKSVRLFEGKIAGSGKDVFSNLNIWQMVLGCWTASLSNHRRDDYTYNFGDLRAFPSSMICAHQTDTPP